MEKLDKRDIQLIIVSVRNEFEHLSKDLTRRIHTYDFDEITCDIATLEDFDKLLRKLYRKNFGVENEQ